MGLFSPNPTLTLTRCVAGYLGGLALALVGMYVVRARVRVRVRVRIS